MCARQFVLDEDRVSVDRLYFISIPQNKMSVYACQYAMYVVYVTLFCYIKGNTFHIQIKCGGTSIYV